MSLLEEPIEARPIRASRELCDLQSRRRRRTARLRRQAFERVRETVGQLDHKDAADLVVRVLQLAEDVTTRLDMRSNLSGPVFSNAPSTLLRVLRLQLLTATLSGRQKQIVGRLLKGKSEKEIAEDLAMSVNTVHVHTKIIYRWFGIRSRAELLSQWIFAEL